MKKRTLLLSATDTQRRAVADILGHDVEELKLDSQSDYNRLGKIDVVVSSPSIYLKEGSTDEDELFFALEELAPELFVIETVRGLTAPRWSGEFEDLIADLETVVTDSLGRGQYDVAQEIVTIQGRKRLVIVGRKRVGADAVAPTFKSARRDDAAVNIAGIITENLRRA